MNPFIILNADIHSTDEEIRQKYVEKIKEFPPEKNPEKFAEIKKSYDSLKDEWNRYKTFFVYNIKEEQTDLKTSDILNISNNSPDLPKLSSFIQMFEASLL